MYCVPSPGGHLLPEYLLKPPCICGVPPYVQKFDSKADSNQGKIWTNILEEKFMYSELGDVFTKKAYHAFLHKTHQMTHFRIQMSHSKIAW